MNVDFRESGADAPDCIAAWKCAWRTRVAGAERESDGGSAMTIETKSSMAASGWVLDHATAPGLGLATSMTRAATSSQMFSVPAR